MARLPGGVAALALVLIAAVTTGSAPATRQNPLLTASTLPFGAPPFNSIKDGDYLPALRAGMTRQRREIAAIANDPAPATFDNTIVAMERSGQLLGYAENVFFAVASANADVALQQAEATVAPELAAEQDAINLNGQLFARIRTLYRKRTQLHLDPEQMQLLKVDYRGFVDSGALLNPGDKAKLRDIDEQLATLGATFDRKLLAGTAAGALVVSNRAQLAGMSAGEIAAAKHAAEAHHLKGKYLIALQNTTQQPALADLKDRATRQALFENSWNRNEKGDANDTRATIAAMAYLRAQRAHLLGYPNFAASKLVDQMAKTPQTVQKFLQGLIPAARVRIVSDAAQLQAAIDKSGRHFELKPWDWSYYAARVRRQKYGLDQNAIRSYFELNDVMKNGLFYAANRLYGIVLKERYDIPVYQSDVRVFEVYDANGSPLGLMYFDLYKRDNKSGGAWMNYFVGQSKLLHQIPVVTNVENIPKPAPGQPTLMTVSEVSGMFHEFGHALNEFFATQEYPSLAGTNTARDFVEYPSQFNEHWALYPAVLQHYAIDYKTGQHMPQTLIDKIEAARNFNQGYSIGELLAADELDMAWHTLPASAPKQNADAFETKALAASGTDFPSVPPRYRSSYFKHIWTAGYAAGYYAYTWTEMLDDDTYQWFLDHGGMTRANGQRFRDMILSKGHSEDYGTMFRAFYGSDPQVGPLLQFRGLTQP